MEGAVQSKCFLVEGAAEATPPFLGKRWPANDNRMSEITPVSCHFRSQRHSALQQQSVVPRFRSPRMPVLLP
jgi:hypothetical protein